MAEPLIIKNSITINAPAATVWDALVNPEQTKQYMFGCETVSDWKPGSELLWKGTYEGKEMVFVKGEIIAIQPEKFLEYTTLILIQTLMIRPKTTCASHMSWFLTAIRRF
jgi:uncharacterized protein YndB with AHSA1/START domain